LPGRYKIRASFCQRLWEEMPTQAYTPEFDVIRSASASNKSLKTDAYSFYRTIAFHTAPNFKNKYRILKGNTP